MKKGSGARGQGLERKMRILQFTLTILFLLTVYGPRLTGSTAYALDLHGFVQGNYAARVTGDSPPAKNGSDYLLSEERLQLELTEHSKDGSASFFIKSDFFRDGVAGTDDMELREGYINYTKDLVDLRVGRQIITWGTGDLMFINDVFPKDYGAFFSGRPMEYLKAPVDGAKVEITVDLLSAELVAIPTFEPNRLPDSTRFYLYNPFSSAATITTVETEKPGERIRDTELAMRLFRYIGSTDVSLYAYKGFYRMSGMMVNSMTNPTTLTYIYPELTVYGGSITGNIFGGVGNIEGGYYDSAGDRMGDDPTVENSKWKFLAGYKKELGSELTVGIQYYTEIMEDYGNYESTLPSAFPKEERIRSYTTLRLTKMLLYQTLRLSFFGIYSPSDEDYLLNPEAIYKLSDELSFTLGGNVFGGRKEFTMFGQLEKNDNLYANLRYQF
ncbi:MAG: DUF1302 family protein [Deltaproteobacteria bacterium]